MKAQQMAKWMALAALLNFIAAVLQIASDRFWIGIVFIGAGACFSAAETGVPFLPSDFKKRDGYKKSIELSREYCLYRQNYCGCEFSSRPEETDAATQVMTAVVSKSIAEGSGQGKAGSYET